MKLGKQQHKARAAKKYHEDNHRQKYQAQSEPIQQNKQKKTR